MADNLSFSIIADTSAARADLKLLNAEISKTAAALKQAVKAGDTAAVSTQRQALQGLYQQQAKTTAIIQKNTSETKKGTAANKEHEESLRSMGLELGHLAHLVGLPIEGIKALKFGFAALAAGEIVRAIKDINSEISELVKLSRETRFDPSTIQAWSLAIERAGGKAETATESIKTFGDAVLEQQKAMKDAEAEGRRAFSSTLAGGGTYAAATAAMNKVIAEANQSSKALNGSLAQLNVTAGRFATNANGMREALHQAAVELVRLHQSSELEADLMSREVFGKPYADMAAALKLAAAGSGELLEKQEGLVKLTAEQIQANAQYQAVVNAVSKSWSELATVFVTDVGPAVGIVLESLVTLIQLISKAVEGWKELAGLFGGGEGGGGAVELSDKAQARIDSGEVQAHARGGYIRGPGTGTSDSILARLSAGEFVVNAARVRKVGLGFLQRLNGFADGGFVGPAPLRFAAGGLVPGATGGTPVHLHLDGQSFATNATESIAGALVVAARRQQMRSAGVKPSWYGGRPGA